VTTDSWTGLYSDGWRNEIVPDAFYHPAKYSRALIRHIYEHLRAEGWAPPGTTVLDPFGGVALGGLDAMRLGLHYIGVELEPRFVALGQANIDLWNKRYAAHMPGWGSARIIQGDSRRLLAVVAEAGLMVSSPPYAHDTISRDQRPGAPTFADRDYGQTPGQLGAMPPGSLDAALMVSSPPFRQTTGGVGVRPGAEPGSPLADAALVHRHAAGNAAAQGYGAADGQLANMPEGTFDIGIGSPPYSGSLVETGKSGIDWGKQADRETSHPHGYDGAAYGAAPGQLANMAEGSAQAVVSSPPYEANDQRGGHTTVALEKRVATYGYGKTIGNIGNDTGTTFWEAAAVIVAQTYAALRPGGHAVFVLKRFVRDGKIVNFPQQWATLCESVGFQLVHWHRAMLTEDKGTQLAHDGNHKHYKTSRFSFFRRIHAKKYPHLSIDWEDCICLVKPELESRP